MENDRKSGSSLDPSLFSHLSTEEIKALFEQLLRSRETVNQPPSGGETNSVAGSIDGERMCSFNSGENVDGVEEGGAACNDPRATEGVDDVLETQAYFTCPPPPETLVQQDLKAEDESAENEFETCPVPKMESSDDDSFHSTRTSDTPDEKARSLPPSSDNSGQAIKLSISTDAPSQRSAADSSDDSVVESSICGSPDHRGTQNSAPSIPGPSSISSSSQSSSCGHGPHSSVHVLSAPMSDDFVVPETDSSGSVTLTDDQSLLREKSALIATAPLELSQNPIEERTDLGVTAPLRDSVESNAGKSTKCSNCCALVSYNMSSDEDSSDDSDVTPAVAVFLSPKPAPSLAKRSSKIRKNTAGLLICSGSDDSEWSDWEDPLAAHREGLKMKMQWRRKRPSGESSSESGDSDVADDDASSVCSAKNDKKLDSSADSIYGLRNLPPVDQLSLDDPPLGHFTQIGVIGHHVDCLLLVTAFKSQPTLDIGSKLFLREGQAALGRVFDVFGRVNEPCYVIRFNSSEDAAGVGAPGTPVYFAPLCPNSTKFVFPHQLLMMKGTDASGLDDVEIDPGESSDDDIDSCKKPTKRNVDAQAPGHQRRFVRGCRRGAARTRGGRNAFSRGGMFPDGQSPRLPSVNAFTDGHGQQPAGAPRQNNSHRFTQPQREFRPPNFAFPPPGASGFGDYFRPPDPSVMANIFSQPPPPLQRPNFGAGPRAWRFPWQNPQNGPS